MSHLKDSDFVVEAVIEDLDLKKAVFKELDELCRPEVILATNTSSMSLTEIARATNRPDKVCGMHFFNWSRSSGGFPPAMKQWQSQPIWQKRWGK